MRVGYRQNHDRKFDLRLSQALIYERRLGEIFRTATIEKIELKSETWQWEQTHNICVEYRRDGRPSGISTTTAGIWVHELLRNGELKDVSRELDLFSYTLDVGYAPRVRRRQ